MADPTADFVEIRKKRANILAGVDRAQDSVKLARRDERRATARYEEIVARANRLMELVQRAKNNPAKATIFQQELDATEHEFQVEKAALERIRRSREEAQASLLEAEQARECFVRDIELVGAPGRYEDLIGKVQALLLALAAAAVGAGMKVGADHNNRMAVGLGLAASLAGLLTYAPALVASAADAGRARRGGQASKSLVVAWHSGFQQWRGAGLLLMGILIVGAWGFVLRAFYSAAK